LKKNQRDHSLLKLPKTFVPGKQKRPGFHEIKGESHFPVVFAHFCGINNAGNQCALLDRLGKLRLLQMAMKSVINAS